MTGGADGLDVALQAAKRLGLPFSEIDRWSDFGREFLAAGPEPAHPLKVEALQDIHRIIGHPIKAPYLAQALVRIRHFFLETDLDSRNVDPHVTDKQRDTML